MREDGDVRPAAGALRAFRPPSGPGVRVDTYGYAGYAANPNFDSLIAKVITRHTSSDFSDVVRRARRALAEFQLEGADSNIDFLSNVLANDDFVSGNVHTRWIDEHIAELATSSDNGAGDAAQDAWAGAKVENQVTDPLAALDFFRQGAGAASLDVNRGLEEDRAGFPAPEIIGPPGTEALRAPIQGTIIQILVEEGDSVAAGQDVMIMNAMKMEHVLQSDVGGHRARNHRRDRRHHLGGPPARLHRTGAMLAVRSTAARVRSTSTTSVPICNTTSICTRRCSTTTARDRWRGVTPKASAPRARTFLSWSKAALGRSTCPWQWPPNVATARGTSCAASRRPTGLICGIGTVNADLFDNEAASTAIISYDETVWAGTQGGRGHEKTDRMVETAHRLLTPLVFIAEGAGGRSGDSDWAYTRVAARAVRTFERLAELSGKVPMVSITAGRCFAGNASMLGMCDIIVATEGSNIAMGRPGRDRRRRTRPVPARGARARCRSRCPTAWSTSSSRTKRPRWLRSRSTSLTSRAD